MSDFRLYSKIKEIVLLILVMSIYSSAQVEFSSFDTSGESVVYKKQKKSSKTVAKSGGVTLSMGDYIWFDYNQNGMQDAGELGIYGIAVKLYENSDCSGSPKATTWSSDIGYYRFDNIVMGQPYCLELDLPSHWMVSARQGDSKFDASGKIENITLSATTHSFDAGLHHKDEACQIPSLSVGRVGRHDQSKSWAKRASLDVKFDGLVASGYCHEYTNSGPQGENYSVHMEDRRGFTNEQRDKLSRLFRFMSDAEVISLIEESFDSSNKHIWFNVISNSFVWFYSDWREDFTKIEHYIDSSSWSSNLTDAEKVGMKRVSRLIIDKIEQKQYQPMRVYYLWNDDNDQRQDIIVPETLLVPDRAECAIEPEPELITIGNRVWVDSDFDGIQDVSESGYDKPIVVELYNRQNRLVAKTKTDNSGIYSFENVVASEYFVKFSVPNGYRVSPRDTSGSCSNSDADKNGKSKSRLYDVNYDCTDMGIYIEPKPKIDIEKSTNGVDADSEAEAVLVDFGSEIRWSYTISNRGNVVLKSISASDVKTGKISCPKSMLGIGESMECRVKKSKAVEGLYSDTAKVVAQTEQGAEVKDSDLSYYRGSQEPKPKIKIEKSTNGVDADRESEAVELEYDSKVTWSYIVTNIGNVKLKQISVKDDKEGKVKCPQQVLEAGKSMSCTSKSGKAKEGLYKNIAKVKAKTKEGTVISDSDSSHYKGSPKPQTDPVPPVAKDDYRGGEIGKAVTLQSLKNDSDEDGDIDSKTVKLIHPDATDGGKKLVVVGEGVWSVNPTNGDITFTPKEGFIDDPTAVEYRVADSKNNWSNSAKERVDYPDSGKAILGDRVWFDMDKNGKQDEGEVGLEGIKVELYDSTEKIKETQTDENGTYSFVDLMAGEYFVKFIAKDGWRVTTKDSGSDDRDSDANPDSGKTDAILVENGDSNLSWDAGMYQIPKPRISLEKLTNNGDVANIVVGDTVTWSYKIKNSGNVNLSNIELVDDKEGVIACPQDNLVVNEEMVCKKSGTAILGEYKNSATVKSLDVNGESVTATDSSSYIGKEAPIELGALGDKVWLDIDRDGIQDSGEPGISGIKVKLLDINRVEVAKSKTNQNGNYFFENLEPKEYRVLFELPKGYRVTKQNQGGDNTKDSDTNPNGQTALITVVAGEEIDSIDMGIYQAPAKLGNRVWYDKNENGIQDGDERGIAGIEVKLYNHSDNLIATKSTDNHGIYQFGDLAPNKYYVKFVVPNGYTISPRDTGNNDSKDSDADSLGKTDTVTLVAGEEDNSLDMGLFQKLVKLGDKVWYDADKNGIQDSGESGIKDVKVELYRADGEFVSQTMTDSSGLYMFDGLIPDKYYIVFTPPTGYVISNKDQGGDDTKDSDANSDGRTSIFTLESGKDNATVDMGLYQQRVSFGNFVWLDTNHNGIQDEGENGVKDVNVTLFGTNGAVASMMTDENGNYLFTGIAPGDYYAEFRLLPSGHILAPKNEGDDREKDSDVYKNAKKRFVTKETTLIAGQNSLEWDMGIYKTVCPPSKAVLGDLVWNDVNKNGIQDIGESGIEGVKVALYNYNTDEKIATTTTNENGNYEFTSIDIGEYYLIFEIPTGYFVSLQDQADSDALDSDTNAEGRTDVITLQAGKINSSVDMGLHQKGSTVGDRVWYDENSNGIQDEGELGVNGVSVVLKDLADTTVDSTVTNASGEYHFTNVNVGTYTIEFSNLPADYIFSHQDQGGDDTKDSDVNSDGVTESFSVAGASNIVTIDAGIRRYDMPSSSGDIAQGVSGDAVSVDVLSNDTTGTYNFDLSTLKITTTIDGAIVSEDGRTITVAGEGIWRVNLATGAITFTPEEGFSGDPTAISYTVSDSHGNETGSEIKINYPPVAKDDSVNGAIGQRIVIHVLDNDTATSSPLDATTVRLIDSINGSEVERVEVLNQGVWSVNSNGTVIFTPNSGLNSAPTPIEYIVRESEGDVSNRATITIIYPMAVDDTLTIEPNQPTPYIIDVTANDRDDLVVSSVRLVVLDGTTTSMTLSQDGKQITVVGEGVWSVNERGLVSFTPESEFAGTPTAIGYSVANSSGVRSNIARIAITQNGVDSIVINNDVGVADGSNSIVINILENDSGDINSSSILLIGANGKRDTRIVVVGEGVWSIENGVVTFIPEEGYNGTPTPIRYTIVDVDRRDNVDGDGSSGNEANISIKGECVCKEYKSDISSLGLSGILLLSTLLFVVGGFLFREEEFLAL
jgi:CshA-type fibril repeat protein